MFDDEGTKIFDGSAIVGGIFDRSWFRIKRQDMFLDTDYNANNRTWQYYLNLIKMYNFSLFANGVIFATSAPTVAVTAIEADTDAIAFTKTNDTATIKLTVTPITGTTAITWSATDDDVVTLTPSADGRSCLVTCIAESSDTETITATCGNLTDTVAVTVTIA